jgi:hypothetical protein
MAPGAELFAFAEVRKTSLATGPHSGLLGGDSPMG